MNSTKKSISKELISQVTKRNIVSDDIIIQDDKLIYRYRFSCVVGSIYATESVSINDFLQECKLWAYEQGFEIKEEVDSVVISKDKDTKVGCVEPERNKDFIPYDRNRLIISFNNLLSYMNIKIGA